jgi:hypothetical protein
MANHYILKDRVPVAVDILEWAKWWEQSRRTIELNHVGEATVSTVFLGLDHNWEGGPPLLFETMIFGGPLAESQWRYASWDEAVAGHALAVLRARAATQEPPL